MIWSNIPKYYQYFDNPTYGGWPPADFCPVSVSHSSENKKGYYIGHCSSKGSGEYGSKISYRYHTYNKSEELYSITGETYSDHSYCFLSSLTKNNTENFDYYSKVVRAVCFESFCSNKSLTIKIHDDYIVCPRAGGKIEVEGYKGYILCPDYNLMCSGTVLCNDMFDCVEKKSEIKEESYYYDYEIKTSQNIEAADTADIDEINNYELSENGLCPLFCEQCKENNKCIKCRNNYGLLVSGNNEEKIICLQENELFIGYYKNNSLYYKCIENCDNCSNKTSCNKCKNNFTFYNNKCIQEIENCKEYDFENQCIKCIDNYAFQAENRNNCFYIGNFSSHDNNSTIPEVNMKTQFNSNFLKTTIQKNNTPEKSFINSYLINNNSLSLTIPTKSNIIISNTSIIKGISYINQTQTISNINSIISKSTILENEQMNIISTLSKIIDSNIDINNSQIINIKNAILTIMNQLKKL